MNLMFFVKRVEKNNGSPRARHTSLKMPAMADSLAPPLVRIRTWVDATIYEHPERSKLRQRSALQVLHHHGSYGEGGH